MIEEIQVEEPIQLDDYGTDATLVAAVNELRREAETLVPRLKGRRVWMINSTSSGGGVAEMLPKIVSIMNELGVETRWLVLHSEGEEFFRVTKHIHNMIHGVDGRKLCQRDREILEQGARENFDDLADRLGKEDFLVVHDPQPLSLGAMAAEKLGMPFIWRSHIGVDKANEQSDAAWEFLEPYACMADTAIFSAPEYIPSYLVRKSSVIPPAIDPLSHKNRYLSPIKTMGILCNSGLATAHAPTLFPDFKHLAQRFRADGTFSAAKENGDIGIPYRPLITQVSRWDKLKGWDHLLDAFVLLKERAEDSSISDRQRRRLEIVRLVMAGPDPASVADDPESREVLDHLCEQYKRLPAKLQDDVALVVLPMDSRKENALMVNVLQRCSTIVVQNSVEEGFGLTAAEALFKRVAFVGTRACGLRQQVRDKMEGRLVSSAENVGELADTLFELLEDSMLRDTYARNGQRRIHDEFLVFKQVERLLETFVKTLDVRNGKSG